MKMLRRSIGKLIAILLLCGLWSSVAWADSPLTSTDFHQAYLDRPQVRKALACGRLDDELAAYILSPGTSYGEAAAVINALGWDTDGKDNHLRLLRRLQATDPQAYRRFGAGKGSTRVLRRRLSVGDGRLLRHAARNTCSGRQGARRRSFS